MRGLFGLLIASADPAEAAQIAYTRPQLCGLSTSAVVAEVTGTEVRWSDDPDGGIETVVWLATKRTVRGPAVDTVELVLPGGTIGDVSLIVEDVPALDVDRTYLFLLLAAPEGVVIVGGERGAIPLALDAWPGENADEAVASLGDCRAP